MARGVKRFRMRELTRTVKGKKPIGGIPANGSRGKAGSEMQRKMRAHASAPRRD